MDNTRKKQLALEAASRLAAQANKELDQTDQSDQTDLVKADHPVDPQAEQGDSADESALDNAYTAIPEEHANTGKIFFPD